MRSLRPQLGPQESGTHKMAATAVVGGRGQGWGHLIDQMALAEGVNAAFKTTRVPTCYKNNIYTLKYRSEIWHHFSALVFVRLDVRNNIQHGGLR